MHLIYKEDNIALLFYFLYKSFTTALELSSELSTCNKCGKVEEVKLLILNMERHISANYPLCDTLGNGWFTNARFAYKAWVVLLTS